MAESARLAYAHGRLQARHSRLPGAADWRGIEASQDFDHLLELLRGTAHGRWIRGVAPASGSHDLERALRLAWRAQCQEVAGWYPAAWRPALLWLAWLPWLPLLESLARLEPAPRWLRDDPLLAPLANAAPAGRLAALADTPLAALAPEWRNGGQLDAGWRRAWRALWPAEASALDRRRLAAIDAVLAAGALQRGASLGFAPWLDAGQRGLRRSFRRSGVSAPAAAAWLALVALDLLRVRAALTRVRLFGAGTAA